MTYQRSALVLIAVVAVSGVPRPARAQRAAPARDPAAAEVLFRDAIATRDKGDWASACAKLDASMALDGAPSTLINIAKCHEHDGKIAVAWADLQRAIALNAEMPDAKRKKDLDAYARTILAGIEQRLPTLTLTVRERPAGLRVTRDGLEIPAGALGEALPADPGPHVIEATAPGRAPDRQTVTLVEGKAATVELALGAAVPAVIAPAIPPVAPPAVPPSIPAPPQTGPSGRRVGAYVAGGVGLAGVVVGAVAGGLMLKDKGIVSSNCTDAANGVSLCKTTAGVNAGNDARTAGLASSVGWAAAVAGLTAGVVLFATEPRDPQSRSGRGVLSVSATGSAPTIEGSWSW